MRVDAGGKECFCSRRDTSERDISLNRAQELLDTSCAVLGRRG